MHTCEPWQEAVLIQCCSDMHVGSCCCGLCCGEAYRVLPYPIAIHKSVMALIENITSAALYVAAVCHRSPSAAPNNHSKAEGSTPPSTNTPPARGHIGNYGGLCKRFV